MLFEEGVEFCGYVGVDYDGNIVILLLMCGDVDLCLVDEFENFEYLMVLYYMYGNFSIEYLSEMLSGIDMEGDEEEGIDGWVVIFGGWLWYIDIIDMVIF